MILLPGNRGKDETTAVEEMETVEEVETNEEVAPVEETEVVEAKTPAPTTSTVLPFQVKEGTLRAYGRDLNLDWGTNLSGNKGEMYDADYMKLVAQQLNLVKHGGPSIAMKNTQPTRGLWDFSDADYLVEFAETNEMKIRSFLIYGYPYSTIEKKGWKKWHPTPNWVHTGNFTREDMLDILNEHITEVVNHFGDRVDEWRVVNEILDGTGELKQCVWTDKQGVPIDAVGLQFHLEVPTPSYKAEPTVDRIVSNFNRYGDLGLDVLITELDVRIQEPITEEKLERQAEIYAIVVEAVLESDNYRSISLQGLSDKWGWYPKPGYSSPCLFDDDLEPKPAYYSVIEVMEKYLNGIGMLEIANRSGGWCSF